MSEPLSTTYTGILYKIYTLGRKNTGFQKVSFRISTSIPLKFIFEEISIILQLRSNYCDDLTLVVIVVVAFRIIVTVFIGVSHKILIFRYLEYGKSSKLL